jgi:ABC-2 type transport system permease protein
MSGCECKAAAKRNRDSAQFSEKAPAIKKMRGLTIARNELRLAWRARLLWVLASMIAVMLVTAALVGRARYSLDETQRARFQVIVGEQWREQPNRHPHRVSHYGFLLFRPRAPLGFFDTGVESFTGSSIFLEAHRQNFANFSDAAQTGGARRFGELTVAMALQLFLPLIVFVVAGVSVTREREAGTLVLLLSQGASWRSILWGKFVGTLGVVGCFVVPGVALAASWMLIDGGISWNRDVLVRGALLAVVHVGYVAACTAAAILVSATHRTSRAALVTLIGLWISLWVIFPRALPGLGASLYATPTRSAFEAQVERQVRELGDSHNPDDPKFQALRAEYLKKYGVAGVDELPLNYNGVVTYEAEKLTTNAYREQLSALLTAHRRQARLIEWAGFLDPYIAIRAASTALAGVDVPHAVAFEQQAEAYRYDLIQKLNELHIREVEYARDRYEGKGEGGAPTRQRISREHWSELPEFNFTWPAVTWAMRQSPLGVIASFAWAGMLLGAVSSAARRPPRL